ncbi:MAG TPA: hypothetical protein DEP60_02620 [Ruminococcaceae bacterium]|nr:hypothetical protein [Oscillospiraceae bacterium]
MAIEKFYLTAAGENLLAKAQTGQKLNFTKMQIGQGTLSDGTDVASLTALVDPVKDVLITAISANKNAARVEGWFSNQGISIPFYWHEIGLYANMPDVEETLYAYGYASATADKIPAYSVSPTEFLFVMTAQVGNAANITATIDSSLICAKKKDVDALKNGDTAAGKVAHSLTFSGGSTATYDGSAPVSVKIPSTPEDVGAAPDCSYTRQQHPCNSRGKEKNCRGRSAVGIGYHGRNCIFG